MSTSTDEVYSESEEYGAIYFFAYALITVAIIFGAYHFVGRIRLSYHTYQMMDSIHDRLSVIEIAKQGFRRQSEAKRDRISRNNNDITSDSVRDLINKQFEDMALMLENHKNYLLSEIDKIDQSINNVALLNDNGKPQIDFELDYKDRMFPP